MSTIIFWALYILLSILTGIFYMVNGGKIGLHNGTVSEAIACGIATTLFAFIAVFPIPLLAVAVYLKDTGGLD